MGCGRGSMVEGCELRSHFDIAPPLTFHHHLRDASRSSYVRDTLCCHAIFPTFSAAHLTPHHAGSQSTLLSY